MYEYKVISGQITPNYKKKETFESCLEKMLNEQMQEGWEFYSQGSITEMIPPGCLGMLLGQKTTLIEHQTFIFRREKQEGK